jgi:CheY-like chemotaxis protein
VAVSELSVLVIEDNPDAREMLAELLQLEGHETRVACDGRSGIVALQGFRPDVILCDVGLPDISGYEVMQQIRQLAGGSSIFSVALTGYAQPEDVQRATDAGFDAHLPKPPSIERLREVLVKVVRSRDTR